jgi:hypothetical protein
MWICYRPIKPVYELDHGKDDKPFVSFPLQPSKQQHLLRLDMQHNHFSRIFYQGRHIFTDFCTLQN